MASDTLAADYEKCVQWLAANNFADLASVLTEKLALRADLPVTGRGFAATDKTGATVKITLPRSLMLSADFASQTNLKEIVGVNIGGGNPLSADDLMTVLIMHLRLNTLVASADASDGGKKTLELWRDYIKLFPQETVPCMFTGKENELALIATSNIGYQSERYRAEMTAEYERIFTAGLLQQVPHLFPATHTYELYLWAWSMVMSRAFDLVENGERLRAFCPFVDMFNHDVASAAHHEFNDGLGSLEITIPAAPPVGSEVFLNYGPWPNSRLFQCYGFAVRGNPADIIEFVLPLEDDDPLKFTKIEVITRHECNPVLVELTREVPTELALGPLRVSLATRLDARRLDYAFEPGQCISRGNETQTLKYMHERCTFLLSLYPDDVHQQVLAAMQASDTTAFQRNAYTVWLGEREILQANVDFAHRMLEARTSAGEKPQAKPKPTGKKRR